ncbi:MAG: ATP-dependent RecD-like DNA helicase [Acidobacteriota bacterium]|nr:ATP-dependent RecD-like DNA helicase [Acidobacteriota bacterium]
MENFEGTIEQIVFYNPENGYTVCKFSLEDGRSLTIVGSFPPLSPGETLTISGRWELNPRFGRQFKVDNYQMIMPATAAGIEKFLASGLIKGIGPVLARRIIGKFGEETMEILSSAPEKLKEVPGVGRVKLREIRKSWEEHRKIRDLIIFLQGHNVSTNLATKIYRQYEDKSFHVLKTNPYQLCLDIWGIGFKTADQIALKLGMDPASLERVKAYILYLLEKDNEQGHVFSWEPPVKEAALKDLDVEPGKFDTALEGLIKRELIVAENLEAGRALYLPFFYQAQEHVARSIHHLSAYPCPAPPFDLDEAVAEAEKKLGFHLSTQQRLAVASSLGKKILVITGGPGTGKTTIVKAIVDIFIKWGREVLLAAPTGRAAQRLSETTGREAKTIHRILEFKPKQGTFKRNERSPLRGDALVIDEFSMVDLPLMHHLLKAVPSPMRLILVGDKDQLPSVGPGSLLRDIIDSGRVEVVRLDEIFRQEKESYIVLNAHRINRGQGLIYPPRQSAESDFYFIRRDDEAQAFETIMKLCLTSVPRRVGASPLSTDIQVISPMYKGLVGVDHLNNELQKRLNPSEEALKLGNREIRLRDKVMQIRNDYDKDVFNGDIGIVVHLDKARCRIIVNYDGRSVHYERDEMNDIVLAYAISVHKAQGSEYRAVVMPLLTQHFIMLQRNLFYTALTRAKKLSVIIGSYKALYIAIKNDKPVKRNCLIKERLIALGSAGDTGDVLQTESFDSACLTDRRKPL